MKFQTRKKRIAITEQQPLTIHFKHLYIFLPPDASLNWSEQTPTSTSENPVGTDEGISSRE